MRKRRCNRRCPSMYVLFYFSSDSILFYTLYTSYSLILYYWINPDLCRPDVSPSRAPRDAYHVHSEPELAGAGREEQKKTTTTHPSILSSFQSPSQWTGMYLFHFLLCLVYSYYTIAVACLASPANRCRLQSQLLGTARAGLSYGEKAAEGIHGRTSSLLPFR